MKVKRGKFFSGLGNVTQCTANFVLETEWEATVIGLELLLSKGKKWNTAKGSHLGIIQREAFIN
jgi:hypothetical protein